MYVPLRHKGYAISQSHSIFKSNTQSNFLINNLNTFSMKKLLLSLFMTVAGFCMANAAEASFNFNTNQYGFKVGDQSTDNYMVTGDNFSEGAVTVTVSTTTENKVRFYGTTPTLRINSKGSAASGGAITVSVASGTITKIALTGSILTKLTVNSTKLTGDSSASWEGSASSVEISNNESSGSAQIKTMTVTYTASGAVKQSANVKFPQASYTVNLGDEFDAPVVTKDTPAAATYASSDPTVAAVNATNGAVTVLAAGTTTITATCEETEDYYKGSASYTLEVVDPNQPGATIDNPFTVAQALEACQTNGPKGIFVKGIVTEVTETFNSQYNNVSFNIADVAGGTEVLLAYRTKWGEGVEVTADKNPQVGATVVLSGNLKIFNNTKELDAGNLIVKYEAPAKSLPEMSFPEETYTVNLGETFTAPTATVTPTLAVKYESSLPAVAEVDAATGAVTIKTYGTTEITATTEETSELLPGKATYTLEVINPEITAENPLTVAEALAVIANNPHKVYVKGVVTEVTTKYSAQYKNVTFNIAATADGTEVLEAFRASWADGVTAPADNNPEVGYTVVISGNLEVYNDKKEISSGKIVSYTKESGVEDVIANDSNAPVKYYNLQGVEVANPQSGLYIRVQGDKATKVIL